jgi:hypothetical protein
MAECFGSYRKPFMEEWLKQNGFILGNSILSGMGLVFAIGAPVIIDFKAAKNWWILLWAALLGFYLCSLLIIGTPKSNVMLLSLPSSLNGVSTSAAAMLYLHFRNRSRPNTRKLVIVFCSIFLPVMLSSLFALITDGAQSILAGFIGQILAWIFFVLIAWNYRKQHMTTTLLLLAYANLQLPAGLVGKTGWGNNFTLLLAAKLSLIGAMYHTLGIRDAKS